MHIRYAKTALAGVMLLFAMFTVAHASGSPAYGYGAIAAGIDRYSEGRDHVGVGAAVDFSAAEAERLALSQCRKSGVESCEIQFTWWKGCQFVTWGENYRGEVGWGIGASESLAVEDCETKGVVCRQEIYGNCITPYDNFP